MWWLKLGVNIACVTNINSLLCLDNKSAVMYRISAPNSLLLKEEIPTCLVLVVGVTVESSSRLSDEANVRPRLALEIGKLILGAQTAPS